jgi:hypothetical protein
MTQQLQGMGLGRVQAQGGLEGGGGARRVTRLLGLESLAHQSLGL